LYDFFCDYSSQGTGFSQSVRPTIYFQLNSY